MPTPAERKALFFLSGLLLLGAGVRAHRALRDNPAPDAAARLALRRQIAAVDSVRALESAPRKPRSRPRRATRDPAPVSSSAAIPVVAMDAGRGRGAREVGAPVLARVDLDVAGVEEIERLPRIGPTLAARIVANRDSLGPFGSLQEFQRVRGVGPAMAKTLEPHVTFSLAPRPSRVVVGGSVASTPAPSTRRRSREPRLP